MKVFKTFETFEEMDEWSKTIDEGKNYLIKVIKDTMSFSGGGLYEVSKSSSMTHLMEMDEWMIERSIKRGTVYE